MSLLRWRRQPAIYHSEQVDSEQVCIGWHRTGACYTDKLTFSHGSSVKVWGAYYTNVRIIFEFLHGTFMKMLVCLAGPFFLLNFKAFSRNLCLRCSGKYYMVFITNLTYFAVVKNVEKLVKLMKLTPLICSPLSSTWFRL